MLSWVDGPDGRPQGVIDELTLHKYHSLGSLQAVLGFEWVGQAHT